MKLPKNVYKQIKKITKNNNRCSSISNFLILSTAKFNHGLQNPQYTIQIWKKKGTKLLIYKEGNNQIIHKSELQEWENYDVQNIKRSRINTKRIGSMPLLLDEQDLTPGG